MAVAWLGLAAIAAAGAGAGRLPARPAVVRASVRASVSPSVPESASQAELVAALAISQLAEAIAQPASQRGLSGASAFSEQLQVDSALWAAGSRAQWADQVSDLADFYGDPRLEVLAVREGGAAGTMVDWMLSGTWPAPWRPRVAVLGSSALEMASGPSGGLVVSRIRDTLKTPPTDVFLRQLLPDWEDVYNLYNSAHAEQPAHEPIGRGSGYQLRRLPPTLVLEFDYTVRPSTPLLPPVLPGFAFTGKQLKTRDEWTAVRPLTAEFAPTGEAEAAGTRVRLTVPVPTRLGRDMSTLPSPQPAEQDAEVAGASARYSLVPARTVAVRAFAGNPADNAAVLSEVDKLLDGLRKDGRRVLGAERGAGGRPAFQVSQYNCKAGFDMDGRLALAQYEGTVDPLRRNEVLVDVETGAGK